MRSCSPSPSPSSTAADARALADAGAVEPDGRGSARRDVERARSGDRAAFRRVYERYAPMVHAILLARVPASDAEDLVQQVFFTAWRKLDTLRSEAHAGGWIAGIARHLALRHHERAPRPALALDEELAAPEAGDDDGAERSAAILAQVLALPPAYRETLLMRLVEGMSGPAIAEACGMTPGSVRVNLTRGMKLLRERLVREGLA